MKTDITTIPERLRDSTFVIIRKRTKIPIGKAWNKAGGSNYVYGDEVLMKHLAAGGSYGILSTQGRINVDSDCKKLTKIIEERLPKTLKRNSPGHRGGANFVFDGHFKIKTIVLNDPKKKDADGNPLALGEIRGIGAQALGPGSIHPNGRYFELVNDVAPAVISEEMLREALAPFISTDDKRIEEIIESEKKKFLDIGLPEIPITEIFKDCTGKFKKSGDELIGPHPVHGSTHGDNFSINTKKNVWCCRRCNTGGGPLEALALLEGLVECSKIKKGAKSVSGKIFRKVIDILRERGYKITLVDPELLYFDAKNTFIPKRLADTISKEFKFATHRQSHDIFVKSNGVYEPRGDELIRTECRGRMGELAKEWHVNEVVKHILETTYTEPDKFESPVNLLNTESGALDIKTLAVVPSPDDVIFLNKIPVKFDKKAKCPKILKFFGEVLHEGDLALMQEIVGYCLYRKYIFHRSVMFLGSGSNGKSTALNLIRALLGRSNTKAVSLQELINDRFAKAELFGKLANIYADIPSTRLMQTGIFKMLVGEDMIRGQKKHRDSFDFWNYAKQLFSANELPPTEDLTEAWWRRWILIHFSKSFPEGGPDTDPHLLEKLTTPGELSGFLNWGLEGLKRLLKNNTFTMTKTRKEIERIWITQTDSLRAFVSLSAGYDKDTAVVKEVFMKAYGEFCADNDLARVDSSVVGRRLPVLVSRVSGFKPKVKDRQHPAWMGLTLKSPYFEGRVLEKVLQEPLDGKNITSKDSKGVAIYLWRVKGEIKEKGNKEDKEAKRGYMRGKESGKHPDNLDNNFPPDEPGETVLPPDIQGLPSVFEILNAISDGSPWFVYKLPKRTGVPKRICFDTLAELDRKGYVKQSEQDDKTIVKITEKGREVVR